MHNENNFLLSGCSLACLYLCLSFWVVRDCGGRGEERGNCFAVCYDLSLADSRNKMYLICDRAVLNVPFAWLVWVCQFFACIDPSPKGSGYQSFRSRASTCTVEDLCFLVVVVDIMVVVSAKLVAISLGIAVVLDEPATLGTSPTSLTLPLILMLGLPSAAMVNTFRPL